MAREYNIFISHSWAYGDAYEKLIDLLDAKQGFYFKDYSIPRNDPIHDAPNSRALYDAIKAKMSPTTVVLILAGVYSTYSEWISKEMKIANEEFQ